MSTTEIGSITALSGGVVNIPSGNVIKGQAGSILTTGTVIQTAQIQSHQRVSYYNYTQGTDQNNWTTLGVLKLPFRPMYANSMVLVKFILRCEMEYNGLYMITKDEAPMMLLAGESFPNLYNGFAASPYDMGDHSSTPNNITMMWMDIPGTTDTVTYAPAFRRSDSGGITCWVNRPYGSSGQWAYENGVSVGMAWEIAQ
jgi:hypothetical protein